jgi:hypothetical protein
MQISFAYVALGEILKSDGLYKESIENFLLGQKFGPERNTDMIIANIYDEKLNDIPNALRYYQKVMTNHRIVNNDATSKYYETVQKRIDFLKQKQAEAVKK